MMKLQDVILKVMAKSLSWIEAAEIAGMSVRNMQRMRQRYREHGYNGLFDQRRGKRSIHRIPMETAERVLALYRDQYFDLNVRHFHEKLREQEGIRLSYSWVNRRCKAPDWWRARRSEDRIAAGGRVGLCRGCCCTSTAVNTAGFRTTGITICW